MDRDRDQALADDNLFRAVHQRTYAVTEAMSGLIALTITLSTLGDWKRFGFAVAIHALLFPFNMFFDRVVVKRMGLRSEVLRSLINHTFMAFAYALIGWPLTAWLWLPFTAVAVNDSAGKYSLAVISVVCSTTSIGAIAYGVHWQIPLVMTLMALSVWRLTRARSRVISEMLQAVERQRDELARAEVELRQAQKLEAIGRLAAGIAHEINTPMQFVSDNLRFVSDGAGELLSLARDCATPDKAEQADLAYLDENMPAALQHARAGVERVASIVRSMKEFAHPGGTENGPVDLNAAITNTLMISSYEYKLVADIETRLGDLPTVSGNGSELNQVLLNLIVNAAHTIGDVVAKTGVRGKISISTAHVGDHVLITVRDTGAGIRPSIRMKVFEPFFTTKAVGRGSGQGLAISRAVIERHGGELDFTSAEGAGTSFTIRLPVTRPSQTAVAA